MMGVLHLMKRSKMLFITVLLVIVMLIAACSGGNGSSSKNGGTTTEGDKTSTNAGKDELKYPNKMKYWVQLNGNAAATMKDNTDVGMYKEYEKITGTQVEWIHPSGEGAQIMEQFNLMLASRNLPDVIEHNWIDVPKGPDDAIKTGTILRLNELMDEHAPHFTQYLKDNPGLEKEVKTDEGNIFAFPFLRGHNDIRVFFGPILRQDMLDKVNMEVPTTISEWEEVLTAFRDANEGIPPFIFSLAHLKTGHGFVGAYGIPLEWYNDNGTVKYGSIQPEFKEFLTTMNRWYEKGLLDPDFAAFDGKLLDSKITGNQVLAFNGYTGSGIGKYLGLMKDSPEFALVGAPYPTLNKGETPKWGQLAPTFAGLGAAVTTAAENPEEVVRWLDFAYGPEGHLLANFGVEGESYEMVDGYPKYTDKMLKNPDGLPPAQALHQYIRAVSQGPFVQDKRYFEQYISLPVQLEAVQTWGKASNEMQMPLVTPNADESRRFASIMNDVNVYHEEMVTRFIMGSAPISEFDTYVETLKTLGIEEAAELRQSALDRYEQR
jgi:putative aldouronate transport system substrate-binding protein